MARASREGGKRRLGGDVAAGDAQGADEGDSVGVAPGLPCGLVHQVAQGVVDQEEREDLLFHSAGVLGAQDEPGPALMGLDLVQGGLDLSPLGVERGELARRCLGGVEDGGDQPVDGGVAGSAEGVLDDADPDGVGAAVPVPGGDDLRQVGAVGQRRQDRQDGVAPGPSGQVGAGFGGGPPQAEPAKALSASSSIPALKAGNSRWASAVSDTASGAMSAANTA
ncbi:hypothetical protein [Kitasatospora camelliae]|uniref:Uncharacterized protein n=1 Tax=Kitasatospora camelliae TaxID=3156397 RepID=A0AAU8K5Q8_9ACTN